MVKSEKDLGVMTANDTSWKEHIVTIVGKAHLYRKLDYNNNKKAQKITHTLTILVDHGIMAHIPW